MCDEEEKLKEYQREGKEEKNNRNKRVVAEVVVLDHMFVLFNCFYVCEEKIEGKRKVRLRKLLQRSRDIFKPRILFVCFNCFAFNLFSLSSEKKKECRYTFDNN